MLYVFLFLLLAVALYLAGPKVSSDTSYTIPELSADLDAFLEQSESGCDDLTPGAEKVIHWANPVSKIYYARLTGNGRSADALAMGSVNRWVNDASEALAIAKEIGDRTIIIGTSTGASLAWWAGCQEVFRDQIEAMVFFSPNFGLADTRDKLLTIHWGKQLAEAVLGEYRENDEGSISEAHEKYWTIRYPTRALLPMMAMVNIAKKIKATHWKKPMFIVYSPYDNTIDANKVQKFYQTLTCRKRILEIDDPDAPSQHVIVGDILAPQNTERVTDAVIDFIEKDVLESRKG